MGREMDPATRAAVMVMLLDEQQATQLLGQLEPEELRTLGERMCALGEIDPTVISRTVADFMEFSEQNGMSVSDRTRQVQSLMTGALGEMKAENLMRSIVPDSSRKSSSLELAKWLDPEVIAPLIEDEHPQLIAVLMVQLDPQVAAKVLHMLPDTMQTEVVHRVATLGAVSSDALAMLEELLSRKIAGAHGAMPLTLGGPANAAEIINKSAGVVEKLVMSQLNKIDRSLARRIEGEMFRFEHLFVLDGQSMGALLREVDSETLVDALKGTAEPDREVFFAAMSSRAADGVRDEIDSRGRIKMAEVEAAQKAMVDIARRLASDGVIAFGNSGDDEYV